MTILVVGGTGQIGSGVVRQLSEKGADIRVLSTDPDKARVPPGVSLVRGNVLDPNSLRTALRGAQTLFLLNPVVADELTRALLTLRIAADAGLKGIVYFSMVNADTFADTPHAAAKYAAELMIARFDLPATILRPNCFFQNDVMVKDALLGEGVYAMPVGETGVAMADTRDIAEVAALETLRRDRAASPEPRNLVDISGPDVLTGPGIAAIWADLLGKPITYAGDISAFEAMAAEHMPAAIAFDTALMFRGFERDGMRPTPGATDARTLLGRPMRSYRAFAEEMARTWSAGRGGS